MICLLALRNEAAYVDRLTVVDEKFSMDDTPEDGPEVAATRPLTLIAGMNFVWAAIAAPRSWSCALHKVDLEMDENAAIASLSASQLQQTAGSLFGGCIAAAALFFVCGIGIPPILHRVYPATSGGGHFVDYQAMAFSLVALIGYIVLICVSIRAAFTVWVLGGAAIPLSLALSYALIPSADRGAAVCGVTAAFAIGGAAGTLIKGHSGEYRSAPISSLLFAALLNIVIALLTEALPLLAAVFLFGPNVDHSGAASNDIGLKVSLSSLSVAFAVGLGGFSFFAAWVRACGAGISSKKPLKALFWVFAGSGLGPAAVALGYAGSDTGLHGVAIGLLVGSVAGGVFAMSWNLLRESMPPLASALIAAIVTAGIPILLLFARLVAFNTVQQRWALIASLVMLPIGFVLEASILERRS
jgi:hypothetical protein